MPPDDQYIFFQDVEAFSLLGVWGAWDESPLVRRDRFPADPDQPEPAGVLTWNEFLSDRRAAMDRSFPYFCNLLTSRLVPQERNGQTLTGEQVITRLAAVLGTDPKELAVRLFGLHATFTPDD